MVSEEAKQSICQIEAEIAYHDLISHQPEGKWAKMAPLRLLSVNIECASQTKSFPEAQRDSIIQIANVAMEYGQKRPFVRNIFCVGETNSVVATEMFEHQTEEEMLQAWQKFLITTDPDIIIGYNSNNFDFPYLLDRAKHLKISRFDLWTRLKHVPSKSLRTMNSSKTLGPRDTLTLNLDGRLQLDLSQLIQKNHRLRTYSLDSACVHFLGEQKEELSHATVAELFAAGPEPRRRLAVYGLKEAYFPHRLLEKLSFIENYTEMARVCGVPLQFLLTRGQQVRFLSQLFRKALEGKMVIPNLRNDYTVADDEYDISPHIESVRGYYDVPIAVLEFESLYPSLLQSHNLCYTTLVSRRDIDRLGLVKDTDYTVTPNGYYFVTKSRRKGILPEILEEMASASKKVERELAQEKDSFKRAMFNGRKLALDASANSIQILTGAATSKLPCLEIASSAAEYVQHILNVAFKEVEDKFTVETGYKTWAQVIYGDRDSIFINFGNYDLATNAQLGKEAAHVLSQRLKHVNLKFKNTLSPCLILGRNKYAGYTWAAPDEPRKIDKKGIDHLRKDNCLLAQTVMDRVLSMILMESDVEGAQE